MIYCHNILLCTISKVIIGNNNQPYLSEGDKADKPVVSFPD